MSDPFIGEIRMFAGNFAPAGWAFCHGQLLSIAEYDALFTLIGTTYGGNGETTFALPDLRGRLPIHQGQGAGLTNRLIGEASGTERETLLPSQMPVHTHEVIGRSAAANSRSPANAWFARPDDAIYEPPGDGERVVTFAAAAVENAGTGQPHSNLQPFLCVNFIISLFGIFPSRG